ncbi:hypothetical protein [Flaviaesturariibacter terrae]
MRQQFPLQRTRLLLALFIVSLFVSGLTVWPAAAELRFALGLVRPGSGVALWLERVRGAYERVGAEHGFLFYGYDWLAFAHIVLAGLFIGPWRDPVRNRWVIEFGLGACVAIFPLAFIGGALRGIPFWWQLVDCSFGVFGFAVLWPCYNAVRRFENGSRPHSA